MAKTSKGIYYPYNYSEIADIPEDMKQMAESVNKILTDKEVDETAQNAKIINLQNKVNDLEQENSELANNMPWNTTSGKSLHITDSAKYSKNKLSISGDMEQEKRSGKNLIPLSSNRTLNGVTLSVDEKGIYTLNGTATNVCFFTIPLKNVLPIGTSKTMSLKILDGTASGNGAFYLAFRVRNSDNVYSNVPNMAEIQYLISGKAYVTKTITNECASAEITVLSGVTLNNVKLTIQLEEGTTATEFEQYGATPSTEFPSMPTVCTGVQKIRQFGKNFIPYPYTDSTMTARGINYVSNSNGSISISGTSNSNVADFYLFGNSTDNGNYLHLKQDTYSLKDTGNTNIIYIAREKTLGVLVGINTILQALKTQDCYFYGFFVRVNNGATVNTVIYPQLALGNTDTNYEPYWEQIHTLDLGTTELCAIKDTNGNVVAKDRHVFRNGKWQWEKFVGKIVLNGTEGFKLADNDTKYLMTIKASRALIFKKDTAKNLTPCCSNYFVETTQGNITDLDIKNGVAFSQWGNSQYLYLSRFLDTAEEFKTWLANKYAEGNPVVIYYPLETPIYEDCTAEQSAVLDKLYNNFELAKGTNNIIVESENGVGVNLELDYMQDNILKDEKLEDRVTALENLLSTTTTSALLLDNLQNDLESEVN